MSARTRVQRHTDESINLMIADGTRRRVEFYGNHPSRIEKRLNQLDNEWDVERTLETNASLLSLFGLTMGLLVNRRWFTLPVAVQAFFLQHALQGWCPPLPLLRRLGFRTSEEINVESTALKALLGDFGRISHTGRLPETYSKDTSTSEFPAQGLPPQGASSQESRLARSAAQ